MHQPTTLLDERHLHALTHDSAISPDVIAARGYRTIHTPSELEPYGFGARQRRAPGLLLPVHPTDGGSPPLYVYRPDLPRVSSEKAGNTRSLKYEIPGGAAVRLDCPPMCQPMLADPSVSLWITEGQKKADALASQGACAVALLGVWNWRGRNDVGGVAFLADWDHVALNGRDVRLVFDSDVMTKAQVRQALERLTEHLQRKGAHVVSVYLPNGPNGAKLGVDDYLAQGHSLDDLEALCEAPRPTPQPAPPIVEILDEHPAQMRRPLQIIADHAYAAAWLPCRVTIHERLTRAGEVVIVNPPEIASETRLFVVRDDGVIYGPGGDRSLEELGFDVALQEAPYAEKTWSPRSVKAYRAGRRPDPLDVFCRVVEVVDRFLDFDRSLAEQAVMCELTACHILHTYLLDALQVTGFLWPNGDRGAGKTKYLHVHAQMAYLGEVILAGGSYASLRDLADYGATLAFDDAENVGNAKTLDPDKRALLLAGNRKGAYVSLKEPRPDGTWGTRHVHAYCPRLFSAIHLPDAVLASRAIVIPLVRTAAREKANADPLDYELWPHDRQSLVDDLWALGLTHLVAMRHYDRLAATRARLSGRSLEPWRGILAVALWLEEGGIAGLFTRMEQLSMNYQEDRIELEQSDLTVLVLKALRHLASDAPGDGDDRGDGGDGLRMGGVRIVTTAQVREEFDELAAQEEIEIGWMGDDGRRANRIGQLLRKLRFEKHNTKRARGWLIRADYLHGLLQSYGLISSPLREPVIPVTPVTPVTDGGAGDTAEHAPEFEPGKRDACGASAEMQPYVMSDEEQTVLDTLADLGGASYPSVAKRLGCQAATARRLLESLRQNGLVVCDAQGIYRPKEQVSVA